MLKLYDYQQKIYDQVFELWRSYQYILVQSSTGSGKTPISAAVVRSLYGVPTNRILYIAHRDKLIEQGHRHLSEEMPDGTPIGLVQSGKTVNQSSSCRLHVGSIQSLPNRHELLGGITHVIIDESHHAQAPTYRQIKNYWPRAKILGVTATPVDGLSQVFERIILGPSTKWLIDNGRLSKYKYYAPTSGKMNLEDITLSHGEYSLDDLEQRNDSVQLSGQLVDSYLKYAEGGRGIGFAINVEHSKAYADRYSEAGIPAIHLDANTPTEQRFEAFEKLKNNELKMIWNVGLLGEGVDIPALEIMQNAQPTTSLAKYLQRCGRALRAAPGKEYGIMIDHTDDWLTHGLPCRDRQWGLDGVIKQKREKSEAVKKEDGEIVERKKAAELAERVVEEATVELVDIMASSQDPAKIWWDNKLAELLDICRLKNYKKAWVSYRLMDENAPLEVWEMAADKLEYQKGWAYHQHKKMTQLLAGVV